MHLTLAFLGECSEQEKEEIHRQLSGIDFSTFELTISGLGAFPNESSPRIIWAGIEPNDELMNLQKEISARLEKFIDSKDAHSFVPHITLARKKSRKGLNPFIKQNLKSETPVLNTYIEEFNLKESILRPAGSEHHILHRYHAVSDQ